jgi:HAE1 family hydrophobic/amphiphilic exporter-1
MTINIKDVITRIDGVGDTIVFGARDLFDAGLLDPAQIQARIDRKRCDRRATRRKHPGGGRLHQSAAGETPGAFELAVQTLGRLSARTVQRYRRRDRRRRARDARARHCPRRARLAGLYDQRLSRQQGGHRHRNFPTSGSNALATAAAVRATMEELAKSPQGMAYRVIVQHDRVHPAVGRRGDQDAVRALVLVVIVIILFLQSWRAAIIPIVAIPVSLIGTFLS